MSEEEFKRQKAEVEKLASEIEKSKQELRDVILDLPGTPSLIFYTTVDNVTDAGYRFTNFVKNLSLNMLRFDIKQSVHVVWKELKHVTSKVCNYFSGADASIGEGKDDLADIVQGEEALKIQATDKQKKKNLKYVIIKAARIKMTIDLLLQLFLSQQSLNIDGNDDTVQESKIKLEIESRGINKQESCDELQRIIYTVINVCETVFNDSKKWNPSNDNFERVITQLTDEQTAIKEHLDDLQKSLKKQEAEDEAAISNCFPNHPPQERQRKG